MVESSLRGEYLRYWNPSIEVRKIAFMKIPLREEMRSNLII